MSKMSRSLWRRSFKKKNRKRLRCTHNEPNKKTREGPTPSALLKKGKKWNRKVCRSINEDHTGKLISHDARIFQWKISLRISYPFMKYAQYRTIPRRNWWYNVVS
ncbi:unnamed protein product [Phytomonas sp. EM1]|nr:unnamed protein product [Phytomonas sp. EM1]|eukprot:CCW64399.1 unnamed protein product [Phytomonas sp. isolate EM1]